MLFYNALDASTLELLKVLQKIPDFNNLRLVGGTSLALQYGHRKSIDIDLFGSLLIDEFDISKNLDNIGNVIRLNNSRNIHICTINGIKVDLVNYHYPWLDEVIDIDNLKLASTKDIAAMKISAITGRGTRKDFIDLYFLLQEFSLQQIFEYYQRKYHDGSLFLALKSLSYFEDADTDESPVMLQPIEWTYIKDFIVNELKCYLSKHSG
jgi:hypothetical protein